MQDIYVKPTFKNTERVFQMQGCGGYFRLDKNKNPKGLPSDFIASLTEKISPAEPITN